MTKARKEEEEAKQEEEEEEEMDEKQGCRWGTMDQLTAVVHTRSTILHVCLAARWFVRWVTLKKPDSKLLTTGKFILNVFLIFFFFVACEILLFWKSQSEKKKKC